jgi:hypothetical protein
MADIKQQRRQLVRDGLAGIVGRVNRYLKGQKLETIQPILTRLGRNHQIPYWYPQLRNQGALPNLDGKTVGSIVEMLFVADVEKNVLKNRLATALAINPAKGVDVPDLDLGIKSPSENWCTSEPFSNAFERLLGTDYDVVAVITNYQDVKNSPLLKIQLIRHHYFEGHEIADKGLCNRARKIRTRALQFGDAPARKVFKFFAFAVQSEWLCKRLLELMSSLDEPRKLPEILRRAITKFDIDTQKAKVPLPLEDRHFLTELEKRTPLDRAIIDAADDWLVGRWQEAARLPNDNEWGRLQKAPLDGKLGVSFALQWRYNFGVFFKGWKEEPDGGLVLKNS